MYTSGTTGRPKGVETTHRNFHTLEVAGSAVGPAWHPGDVSLVCMPLFHIAGAGWALLGLYNGCRNIILPDVVPADILRLIESERVTKTLFVPAVILFLLQEPACATTDFGSLELIEYGASPIAQDVLRRAIEAFGCRFLQLYGLTETTGAVTWLPPEDHDPERGARMASCGKPWGDVELRIVDPAGAALPAGEVGEIVCRTAQVMAGYWNRPEATAAAIRDGWFHTGDAGSVDADGYVYIHDRIKDMIISGGENVYPAEVESALFEHPAIADIAVIGVPDPTWGEVPKAVAVLAPGAHLSLGELQAFARERLAGYKVPKSLEIVDTLPRNPSGKVLKRVLRERFGQAG
jgi:acyl-CoA synthetase (AMP-forming)/AMP-acid ligase II